MYTNAQPNITSVGTLASLTVTANITSGNASLGNLASATYLNGTLTTGAQPNITSVGTLVSLNVSGDATVTGNFTVGGTTTYINVETFRVEDPIIELGGGVNGAPLTTNDGKDRGSLLHYYTTGVVDAFMGWDNSNGEFAFGSNVSVSSEVITFNNFGNIRANYFIGNGSTLTTITGANVTGNVTSAVQSHYANIANSVAGSNVSGQVGNALVAGTVYTNAQPNITSVGTLTSLIITGNITSGNADLGNLVTANYFSGNGSLLTGITSSSATTAGTVTTNAQPNITSVGSLSGLTVSNATGVVDFTTTANVTLGSVSNLHISGGTANYVLSTNGSGTLSWVAQTGGGGTTTATIDNFTGNGVQTVFTLSTTPSSENDTIINYNGAILQKNVYSLSGSDITFVAPPADGSQLEITTLGVVSTNDLATTGKAIAMAIVFGF